ncbi:ABC transporter substrate-binding protein [Kocuria turfanensis]|uniref:Alpha-glucoside ABC transporter substrate-binding protein n=1 Tax=Kocuria turfanensis TaxID=388357 RepID=A0A512IAZ1_9MICC|nr:ABC transporter substrate-binding protein [Kocuria turfanensis]GEO94866.1 alpha-glucoside ABC transporter substrate-binding protein [Kocuria turfanensis]
MPSSHRSRRSPSPLSLPGSVTVPFGRRALLGGALGGGMLAALSACGGGSTGAASDGTGAITLGSNQSDAVPKAAYARVIEAFKERSGVDVSINTIDHNTYQEQINSYLQGDPDDVFAWFAGYRMRYFADQGLAAPLNDVWDTIGEQYSDSFREAATAADGNPYFVPFVYYPWAVHYRKSLFEEKGYEIPTTLDEYVALSKEMQKDGLVPIAFADKGGWEAMGTFDILNMRINGYDFHQQLMAGEHDWTSGEVKDVFATWRDLLPYHQEGSLGRDWQEAAQALQRKEAGTYLLGTFVSQQFQDESNPELLEDLDFFTFPEINPEHGTDSIDAPIDGFMMSAVTENGGSAQQLLEFLGSAEAQQINLEADKGLVGASSQVDTSGYTPLQAKAKAIVDDADHIAQFMDRDTRPDFASTVMIPSLQSFVRDPGSVDSILTSIEEQKKAIFAG